MWWTIAAVVLAILWYLHGARVVRARRQRRVGQLRRPSSTSLNVEVNIEIRTKGRYHDGGR